MNKKMTVLGYSIDAVLEAIHRATAPDTEVTLLATAPLGSPLDLYGDMVSNRYTEMISELLGGTLSFEEYVNPYGPTAESIGVDTSAVLEGTTPSDYFAYDGTTFPDLNTAVLRAFGEYVCSYYYSLDASCYPGLTSTDPDTPDLYDQMMMFWIENDGMDMEDALDVTGLQSGWMARFEMGKYIQLGPPPMRAALSRRIPTPKPVW